LEIRASLIKGQDGPVEVEGIGRDVTEQRRLEREVLEISTREQRRMAHDLHDGICQQLAGLAFLADLLAERLEAGPSEGAEEARRISDAVTQVNNQTRQVARGLFPAALEENGLVAALEELAAHAGAFFNTRCLFTCPSILTINDEILAHHLFFIAQEAMLNAARHARPSRILVKLEPEGARFALTIEDDGQGLPATPAAADRMGLRIMRYRARQIGAELEIQSRPEGGTRVRCVFQPGGNHLSPDGKDD
jgi:two-component system, LuxR family, sensor kinase FixL